MPTVTKKANKSPYPSSLITQMEEFMDKTNQRVRALEIVSETEAYRTHVLEQKLKEMAQHGTV